MHSAVVLIAMLALAPFLGALPMAALAALLLLVAWNMSDLPHVIRVLRLAPRSDALVLVTCFLLTVLFDMTVAVTAGVLLAAVLFMRRMADLSGARLIEEGQHPALREPLPPGRGPVRDCGPALLRRGGEGHGLAARHRRERRASSCSNSGPCPSSTRPGWSTWSRRWPAWRATETKVIFVRVQDAARQIHGARGHRSRARANRLCGHPGGGGGPRACLPCKEILMRRVLGFITLILLSGCTLDTVRSKPLDAQTKVPGSPNIGTPEQVTYNPVLNVDLAMMARSSTGLYWKDLVVGDGAEAVAGSTVAADYTGWLPDGRQFDSSKNAGKPYSFQLGRGRVIAGWDEGVAGMRVGGRRLLVIPPALGYGASGAGGDHTRERHSGIRGRAASTCATTDPLRPACHRWIVKGCTRSPSCGT